MFCWEEEKKGGEKRSQISKSPTQVNENFFISTFAFWICASKLLRFTFLMCIQVLLLLFLLLLLPCGFSAEWLAFYTWIWFSGDQGKQRRQYESGRVEGCEEFIKISFLSQQRSFVDFAVHRWAEFKMSLAHTHKHKHPHPLKWADNLWHNMKSGECNKMLLRAPINYHIELVANVIMKVWICASFVMKVQVAVDIFSSCLHSILSSLPPFFYLLLMSLAYSVIFILFQVWENDKLCDLRVRLVLNYIKDLMVCIRKPNML